MNGRYHLAIVVPRYGNEVNGGIEAHAREFATRLAPFMKVTVLTTCALDYRTWADHFDAGHSIEEGIDVLRFPVPAPRDEAAFDAISARILNNPSRTPQDERDWMNAQGPISPRLEQHLAEHRDDYDAIMFMPYLYATTGRGVPIAGDRAVLMTAMHDEPPLRLRFFDELVRTAPVLVVNTDEELGLIRRRFAVDERKCHVVGAGIDPPGWTDPHAFAAEWGIQRPYVVAVGRVDPSKGIDDLLGAHQLYRDRNPDGADLVLVGRAVMDLPVHPWLHVTGFVDDTTKQAAIAGAATLVNASPYESLSLVLLEAWSHGRPVIVTEASEVMVSRVRRCGGGLSYASHAEYATAVELLTTRPALAWGLGRAGWRFSQTQDWTSIIDHLIDALPGARDRVNATTPG